jgi:hypothetical protein
MHLRQQEMSQEEAPNPDIQAPKKPQAPNFKSSAPLDFDDGFSLEFGSWNLGFPVALRPEEQLNLIPIFGL